MIENDWRASYCPSGYPQIWCDCPFEVMESCPGEWTCEDISMITASDMDYYDSNGSGAIDYSDNIDPEHMDMLNE